MTSSTMQAAPATEDTLLEAIAPLRRALATHPLYAAIGSIHTLDSLRLFQQSHVFAVWDFMSLLKALQRVLTCVDLPWQPTKDAASRRLINEIVLGEESDEYQGRPLSHFELYLHAMESCGAETSPVRGMLAALGARDSGTGLETGMEAGLALAPAEAAAFVRSTFAVIATGAPHRIAAAFTLGREDLIPEMFTSVVRALDAELAGRLAPFRYYLERHIELDGDHHAPMAAAMLRSLCPTPSHWQEATESAIAALEARLALWDGIGARVLKAP